MKSLGQAGLAKPKVRPGDMDRFMSWLEFMVVDKATKSYAKEIHEATLAHDKARSQADSEVAEARLLTATARESEDCARAQREALAAETTITETRLTAEQAKLATERDRLEDLGKDLDAKVLDLRLREAGLQRAFAAYNKGD